MLKLHLNHNDSSNKDMQYKWYTCGTLASNLPTAQPTT